MSLSSIGSSSVLDCSNSSQEPSIASSLVEIKHNWLIKNVQQSRDGDQFTSELFPSAHFSTSWIMRLYPSYCERNSIFVKFYIFMIKPKLRTIKAEVVVTCEYNGEEIYKYTWSNASFYCDPNESFDIKKNYVISNFLKSYISSSRDRLLSCPSLTITLQIRAMCEASGCDDLRLIKVRNGNSSIDEPCFTYRWTIDDFNSKAKLCYEDECLESSIFTFEHKLDDRYVHLNNCFQLSLKLERDANLVLMLYHLTLNFKKRFPYKYRIEFFVRANFSTRLLKMSEIFDSVEQFHFDPFNSKDLSDCIQQFNSNPCLLFFLRIVLYGDEENSKFSWNLYDGLSPNKEKRQPSSITEDLFLTGKFSDIKIRVGSKEFLVHRCVLSMVSDVFERMFSSDMIETRSNLLEINDISEEICQEMLRFIYCEKIENLQNNAVDLLYAADKYAIDKLKTRCIHSLIESFTFQSAAEMLIRANLYNSKLLKDNLLIFIKNHSRNIFATEQWKELERTQPFLLVDVLRYLANGNYQ